MNIKTYLLDKKEDIKNVEVKRRLIDIAETKNFIVSVIGPRRAGKTYLLYHFIKNVRMINEEDYLFVNFEDYFEMDDPLSLPIVHKEIYGKLPQYLFFDEIQALDKWNRVVYTLYEKKRYYIFITGSSSKLLSREIATQLRGRALVIKVYPLSFIEALIFKKIKIKKYYSSYEEGEIRSVIYSYMEKGLFPDIVLNNVLPRPFYRDYLDLVIYRDIVDRYGVKNRYALKFFIKYTLSSFASQFSINKIFKTLKSLGIRVSKRTLYSFQRMLEDIRLTFFLRKITTLTDVSLRKLELTIPKVYLVDNGLYRYTVGRRDYEKLLENAVFLELVKGGYDPNIHIFYWRNRRGSEVDFIIAENYQVKHLIQVTYELTSDNFKREVKPLIEASKLLSCKDLKIVTWNQEEEVEYNGRRIHVVPFWKWVLRIVKVEK